MKNRSKENFYSVNIFLLTLAICGAVTVMFGYDTRKFLILGLSEIGISGLFFLFHVMVIRKHHGSLSEFIDNIRFHAETATKDSLINAPMPVVLFTPAGRLLWSNERFEALFDNKDLFDMPFDQVFQSQDKDILLHKKPVFSCFIRNKHFEVKGNYIYNDKKSNVPTFIVFYLYENTEIFLNSEKYLNEQPVVGVITVDNYDDVLLSTPDSHRSLFLAEIDTKIANWFAFTDGVLKKTEKDRYMLFFTRNCLQKMMEEKFSILDDVRQIQNGNKFAPTLSVGIGVGSVDYKELDEVANSAITLALGRGGDQAVVKENNEVQFFGGKSREHEKTTKVKARVTANALKDLMAHADNVIVMGHQLPDMDAIGAAIGICALARNFEKESYIIYENSSPSVNGLLGRVKNNLNYQNVFISADRALDLVNKKSLLVVVDTHRPQYTICPKLLGKAADVVLIDHHRRGEEFIDSAKLIYHEPYASSTCEMVAEILQYAGGSFHPEPAEAEALYAGIMMDTKDFAMKTGVRTFEAAAFLKRCGVDITEIRKFFRNDFQSFVQLSQIISSAITVNGNIAISGWVCNDADANAIAPQAADKLLSISGIEASFVLTKRPEDIAISGRSTGLVNVQLILEKLGGGGHLTMAGAQLKNCSMDDAKQRLIQAINQYLDEI
ncbi:MAG: DHH family phosphoesterase [Clostridia bacterium]|nr:DHH family phosphoesterase [Clostridia bacterium]